MYHAIIKRKLLHVFKELSQGNYEPILASMAHRFEQAFAGSHALGGSRSDLAVYRKWFERLRRIFPNLRFEVRNIVVRGGPWNTVVAVEWVDRIHTLNGNTYSNSGVHIIRMRWTKVTELRIYTDTQKVADLCRIQAEHGIVEATEAPLER